MTNEELVLRIRKMFVARESDASGYADLCCDEHGPSGTAFTIRDVHEILDTVLVNLGE